MGLLNKILLEVGENVKEMMNVRAVLYITVDQMLKESMMNISADLTERELLKIFK